MVIECDKISDMVIGCDKISDTVIRFYKISDMVRQIIRESPFSGTAAGNSHECRSGTSEIR